MPIITAMIKYKPVKKTVVVPYSNPKAGEKMNNTMSGCKPLKKITAATYDDESDSIVFFAESERPKEFDRISPNAYLVIYRSPEDQRPLGCEIKMDSGEFRAMIENLTPGQSLLLTEVFKSFSQRLIVVSNNNCGIDLTELQNMYHDLYQIGRGNSIQCGYVR